MSKPQLFHTRRSVDAIMWNEISSPLSKVTHARLDWTYVSVLIIFYFPGLTQSPKEHINQSQLLFDERTGTKPQTTLLSLVKEVLGRFIQSDSECIHSRHLCQITDTPIRLETEAGRHTPTCTHFSETYSRIIFGRNHYQ